MIQRPIGVQSSVGKLLRAFGRLLVVNRSVDSGLWSKGLLSFAENYSPFEKPLSTCCGALVETEHLTMGHQIIRWPCDLRFLSWIGCRLTHGARKLNAPSSIPSSNRSDMQKIRLEQALKAQVSYMSKWPTFPVSFLLCYFLSFSLRLWPQGHYLWLTDGGGENWVWPTDGSVWYARSIWKQSLSYSLSLGHPWTMVKEDRPQGQTSEQCISLFILLGKRNNQRRDYMPTHGLWPTFDWTVRDWEGTWLENRCK